MQLVPIQPVPSQTFNITLNNQACTINLYQKDVAAWDPPLITELGQPLLDSIGRTITQGIEPNALPSAVYIDLYLNGTLILGGIICLNANVIVRNTYFGFIGDLAFYDLQGQTDPVYTGFGTRYVLVYLAPGDIIGTDIQTLQAA